MRCSGRVSSLHGEVVLITGAVEIAGEHINRSVCWDRIRSRWHVEI